MKTQSSSEAARPRGSGAGRVRRGAVFVGVLACAALLLRWTGVVESIAFYHPTPARSSDVSTLRLYETPEGYEEMTFVSQDGLTLHGWFMPGAGVSAERPGPAVLFTHGNAGMLPDHESFCGFVPPSGVSVLLFDYRSYGQSDRGSRLLRRGDLMKDARAALAYLRTRPEVDPQRVGVMGMSLGATFAAALAAEDPDIRGVVLVAGFSTFGGVAGDHVPVLGPILIPRGLEPRDSLRAMGATRAGRPVLIVHGDRDVVVPFHHASTLERAAREGGSTVQRLDVAGAGHINMLDGAPAQETVIAFVRGMLEAPGQAEPTQGP